MLALIDSDSIIFGCGFAVEHNNYLVYLEEDEIPIFVARSKKEVKGYPNIETVKEVEPLENCLYLVKNKLEAIIKNTKATSYKVYIKGKGNFRDEVAVTREYKGNRDKEHRPVYEKEIRQYLKDMWGAEEVDGMEVDDKVAIEHGWAGDMGVNAGYRTYDYSKSVICSPDKDLEQIPGKHYNYNKPEKGVYRVSEEDALRNLYVQILSGDASDNIQGIKGMGPVTAGKLLTCCKTAGEMYEVCKKEYQKAYKENWEKVLTEMATLVYIKRSENDSWKPPT
jgi:hypothetical protein